MHSAHSHRWPGKIDLCRKRVKSLCSNVHRIAVRSLDTDCSHSNVLCLGAQGLGGVGVRLLEGAAVQPGWQERLQPNDVTKRCDILRASKSGFDLAQELLTTLQAVADRVSLDQSGVHVLVLSDELYATAVVSYRERLVLIEALNSAPQVARLSESMDHGHEHVRSRCHFT